MQRMAAAMTRSRASASSAGGAPCHPRFVTDPLSLKPAFRTWAASCRLPNHTTVQLLYECSWHAGVLMSPFQEFRLWLRRSPRSERAAAALATALVLAVLGWAVVPS